MKLANKQFLPPFVTSSLHPSIRLRNFVKCSHSVTTRIIYDVTPYILFHRHCLPLQVED
jgi:hypothetical protein